MRFEPLVKWSNRPLGNEFLDRQIDKRDFYMVFVRIFT